jgi:4-hydroxybenzoate polyprenyltransferase
VGNVWRAWTMAVIGAWFVISGWVFGTQVGEFVIFGGLTLLGALWVALDRPAAQSWRDWLLALMSAWLAVMPFVVVFGSVAGAYTTLVLGVIGVILAIWMAYTHEETPGTTEAGRTGLEGHRKAG